MVYKSNDELSLAIVRGDPAQKNIFARVHVPIGLIQQSDIESWYCLMELTHTRLANHWKMWNAFTLSTD